MKTKTPRTDKQVFPRGAYGQSAVSADFARQLEAENAALKSRVAELETLAAEMLEPWRDGNMGYMAGGYILKLKFKRWKMILEKGKQ